MRGTTTSWLPTGWHGHSRGQIVFVLSGLDADVLDDLSIVALENPEQARRLVAKSGSCSFVSQAERTWRW